MNRRLAATAVAAVTAAMAQAPSGPCLARGGAPCVELAVDPVPPGLPAALATRAETWRRIDIGGEQHVYPSVAALRAQIEGEWRQFYRGAQAGPTWRASRRFRASTGRGWTSLLMTERYKLGGADRHYFFIASATVGEDGSEVGWTDLLARARPDLVSVVRERLTRRYPGLDPATPPLPPVAWSALPDHLELWWEAHLIGLKATGPEGPPRMRIEWLEVLR
ncbi:MAG: hypothetical protein OXN89_00995 [Bryobacterales bacterium]|nr:hypothetical protein [Bryobacterales bacterium]